MGGGLAASHGASERTSVGHQPRVRLGCHGASPAPHFQTGAGAEQGIPLSAVTDPVRSTYPPPGDRDMSIQKTGISFPREAKR
jgi:hypothetical protein